jgi:hypothetical protein
MSGDPKVALRAAGSAAALPGSGRFSGIWTKVKAGRGAEGAGCSGVGWAGNRAALSLRRP